MSEYNHMQLLKRSMYAMRNGVIADTLRRAGSPFKVIFGVNLPQLVEMAKQFPKDASFAQQVWDNSTTRESMLIAPMLMPDEAFGIDSARAWIQQIPAAEVADVLCLKLLRRMPYALQLAQECIASTEPTTHYTGLRLMCNLAPQHPQLAVEIGRQEQARDLPATRQMAQILLSYADLTV